MVRRKLAGMADPMNDHQTRSPLEQRLIELQTDRAMARNKVPSTSPLRAEMLAHGRIIGGYDQPTLFVPNDEGALLTADSFIAYRRREGKPRVSRNDQAQLRTNFDKIRSGEVIVE
jgi:hypothetical protein